LSGDLILNHIPKAGSSWKKIGAFALTFNPAEERDFELGSTSLDNVSDSLSVPQLRHHLYIEQRRWNHFGRDPDVETLKTLFFILELLRRKVPKVR
ncbi:MAG: hypothetical protein MI867_28820, partial [Pseudomonadales bacterium]|nr:hypothetical protein [Pseudomonadales bacterium]